MMIPSIDIQAGQTVQLVGGKELAIEAGEPMPLAKKFGRVGEIAVIDLDAAMSTGSNEDLISQLLPLARCRVGGGIRDVETAIKWLDAGAEKVILGTAARPEILQQLPSDRVVVALDAVHDKGTGEGVVVDQGWQRNTGASVLERIESLREYAGGFMVTFVEREGQLTGIDSETIAKYQAAVGDADLTVAGGVAVESEIAMLDDIGIDAQIGMALYTGKISLASGFCSSLKSDRADELWPTVVEDVSGQTLGLVYSNLESVDRSLETGVAHYWSRKRGLWKKGGTSGDTQQVRSIQVDCDRDALKFTVQQQGRGFCHLDQPTCFGELTGLGKLQQTLQNRTREAPSGSYSHRLLEDNDLLTAKILEEARELTEASAPNEVVHEAADVLYFVMTKLASLGIKLDEVEAELDRRALKVTRRPGNAKPEISTR